MGARSASTRRSRASTAVSGQAVAINNGGTFGVGGAVVTASTTIALDIVTPGQTAANSTVNIGGGASISNVQLTDSNYTPITGNITSLSYLAVTGTGFEVNGNLFIGNTSVGNVFFSSTQLRANLQTASAIPNGSYPVNYFNPLTSKFGSFNSNISIETSLTIDYLVVAGGGSGGSYYGSGGGGAGGMSTGSSFSVAPGTTYTITVGAGGTGSAYTGDSSTVRGTSGSNSVFSSITSNGGGAGGTYSSSTSPNVEKNGANGGSGGGGTGTDVYGLGTGGTGTATQGNAGGAATASGYGGGGGGAGGAGGVKVGSTAGAGGVGLQSSITGVSTYYAGGGGGGAGNGGTPGAGGQGGGGNGTAGHTSVTSAGSAGTVNTGGGGGSAGTTAAGYNGGSGIVIIRYPDSYSNATVTGSPTLTVSGGYRIYKFTGSGSIKF